MAGPIGGNYFSQINQQLAKGPEGSNLENLRQTGGTAASQTRDKTVKGKPNLESGVQLSEAAKKSLHAQEQHDLELAHHAGLGDELQPESHHEQKVERQNQRHQETLKEQGKGGNPAAAAQAKPAPNAGLDSADKIQARLDAAKLAAYDDPETVYQKVLDDIPEANLEAAERVLETQMKQGAKKMAELKSGPEAQEAGRMEMRQASFMSQPLDIRSPENDRSLPVAMEYPDEMNEMAKERAAQALASGEIEQENLISGS